MFIGILITLDLLGGCVVSPLWYRRRYRQCYLKGGFSYHDWGCGCHYDHKESVKVFDRDGHVIGYKRPALDGQWRGHLPATYAQCAGLLALWPVITALFGACAILVGAGIAVGWIGKYFGLGFARSFMWISKPIRKGIAAFWGLPLRRMRKQVADKKIIYINGHSELEAPARTVKSSSDVVEPESIIDLNGVKYHYDVSEREWVSQDGNNHISDRQHILASSLQRRMD